MTALLQASSLSFAYGARPVLRGVDLALDAGRVVALIGPNGSGKSTLIRVLLGHLRGYSGTVAWEGRDLRQWRRRLLAQRVAYLPQSPAWDAGQTVGDVLRMGRAPYWGAFGLESREDVKAVESTAQSLDLAAMMDRPLDELSGGQRQRVFLGRALVQGPRALLLDEPGTYLDLRHQSEMMKLLRELASAQGIAVLMAGHDLNAAASAADEMILLDDGAIAAKGVPAQVLQPDLLHRVYGVPMERIDRPNRAPAVLPRS